MLVLIYGITGMAGQACAQAAFRAGHRVRGLARNPDKLSKEITDRLEGFVKMDSIYDIAALDEATKGVDAIISAAHYTPEVTVDGQILLLRAAERAGVEIFHGASWNYDWSKIHLGDCESYDSYITFWNHARLSSPINPIFGFTGSILESMFYYVPGASPLNSQQKTLSHFGTGHEIVTFTALENLAAYAVQAISEADAKKGGFYHVESFRCSLRELARVYEEVHGVKLELKSLGDLKEVESMLRDTRAKIPGYKYLEYVHLSYANQALRGHWDYYSIDSHRWNHIKQIGLREWLEKNPDI